MFVCRMTQIMHHQGLFMQNFFVIHIDIFLNALRPNFY
jgi:hypothetical protein